MNRHHPEHFPNKVNDMNIVDLFEMLCDWFAASLNSDTTFIQGLDMNCQKYELPEMLQNIFRNTYNDYLKPFEDLVEAKSYDEELFKDIKLKLYESGITNEYISDYKMRDILNTLSSMENHNKQEREK